MPDHPTTPDGRSFVVKGRRRRTWDPRLDDAEREHLVQELMRLFDDTKRAMREEPVNCSDRFRKRM